MGYDSKNNTLWTKRRIDSTLRLASDYKIDPERLERHNKKLCMVCHYTTRMAGQAFTEWKCQNCGVTSMHHNTAVPTLCNGCAGNTQCKQCGADIDVGV